MDRSMARAVAWNAIARWASQILSWASTIIVARLLTPYDYGLVGMAGLYLQFALLVSQAGIGDAIIALRALTARQIAELNTLSVLVGIGIFGVSAATALPLAHFFSAPPLFAVIIAGSGVFLINALQIVPRALLQRDLEFKLLAGIETVRAFSQVMVTVVCAWLDFRYWSLVLGYLGSNVAVTVLLLIARRHAFAMPKLRQLKRELTFSRDVLVSRMAWYVYDNADFGVAGRVLGEQALGNYTVAWTISAAPVEKIANLVAGVTPAFFSAVQTRKAELRRYLIRLTEILSLVTLPASLGLSLTADYLVPVLLGPKWYGAIGPLRLLGIFVSVRSIGTILPNLLTAIGDARFLMWTTLGAAVTMPVAFVIGSHWGTVGIAGGWVVAYPLIMIPIFWRVFHIVELDYREYIAVMRPALHSSAIMVLVVLVTRWILPSKFHSLSGLVLLICFGAVSYLCTLFFYHRDRVTRLVQSLRQMLQRQP